MPVTISCPKCQTKYQLPDTALGKPVKCRSCGAKFRTKSKPTSGQPAAAPAKPKQPQVSAKKFESLGIDGPLKRQADIFAAPPPQGGPGLNNMAAEDPGFADITRATREVEKATYDVGMEAIIKNPYASSGVSKSGLKKKAKVDVSGYATARIGMRITFVGWIAICLGLSVAFLFSLTVQLAAGFVESIRGSTLAAVLGGVAYGALWIQMLGLASVFLGQIFLIFSPNPNEKRFGGLAVGSLVLAILLPMGFFLVGAIFLGASRNTSNVESAGAVFGLGFIVVMGLSAILSLVYVLFSILYYWKLGENTSAKEITDRAKTTLTMWIIAMVVGVLSVVGLGTVIFISGEAPPEDYRDTPAWIRYCFSGAFIVNSLLAFTVVGSFIVMVKSAIAKTKIA